MKKSKLGLLFLSSLALVTGVASTGVAGVLFTWSKTSIVKAESATVTMFDKSGVASGWTLNKGTSGNLASGSTYAKFYGGASVTNATAIEIDCTQSCSFTIKARKYGGPSNANATITASVKDSSGNKLAPDISFYPTSTSLTDYTRSFSFTSTSTSIGAFFTFTIAKGATSSICVGVDTSTLTYNTFESGVTKYNVSFYDGTTLISSSKVQEGNTVTKPDNPAKEGYVFEGWYTASEGGNLFDFEQTITEDTSLYARWSQITTTTIAGISSADVYYKVSGTVISLDSSKGAFIQDSTGAIKLSSVNALSSSVFKTGYNVSFVSKATLSNGRYILSGDPISPVATETTRTIDLTPITEIGENSHKEKYGQYVSFENVTLTSALESGKVGTATINGLEVNLYGVASYMSPSSLAFNEGDHVNIAGSIIAFGSEETREIVLTSVTATSKYVATFHLNGGTIDGFGGSETIYKGEKFTNPGTPLKDKDSAGTYTFAGWYSDSSLSNEYDFDSVPTGNVDLYAKYTVGELPAVDKFENSTTSASLSYSYTRTVTKESGVISKVTSINLNKNSFTDGVASNEDFSISISAGTYTGTPAIVGNNTSYLQFYAGNEMVISLDDEAGIKIKSITLNCTTGYAQTVSAICDDSDATAITPSIANNTISLVIPDSVAAKNVTVTNTGSKQSRVTSIDVKYEKTGTYENVSFAYNNTAIRFGGFVSSEIWSGLGTVNKYGVMLAKTDSLSGKTIKDAFNDNSLKTSVVDCCTESSPEKVCQPATALSTQLPENVDQDKTYYLFNAYLPVTKEESFATSLTATAYVVVNGEYHFMKQRELSVISLANEYVEKLGDEAKTIYGGSLYALSTK